MSTLLTRFVITHLMSECLGLLLTPRLGLH